MSNSLICQIALSYRLELEEAKKIAEERRREKLEEKKLRYVT